MKKKASNARLRGKTQTSILEAPIQEDRGSDNPNLIVCAANSSRFVATHFNTPLTAYSVGWRDPENLDALLDFIAPSVPVGMRFSWKRALNSEVFLSEVDDIRAIGAAFKRVEFGGEEVDSRTYNKGLTIRVDHDDEVGEGWRQRYVDMLMQRLTRNDLRRAVMLLVAASHDVAKVWDADSNPDGDLRAMLRLTKNATGLRGNRVLMGGTAWEMRQDAYEAEGTNPARYAKADRSPEQIASYLMVNGVRVSEAIFQNGAAKADIVGSIALAYYGRAGLTKDDPSHIKRFITPTAQGAHRVYVEEHDKYTDLSVEHYSNNVVTVADGIEKLTVSAA